MNRLTDAFTAEVDADAPAPVGAPLPHESAQLHVTGAARYIDDLPELAGTLHAAPGLSPHAHARLRSIDLAAVRASPGVVDVLLAADIPGLNDCGPVLRDDPILAADEVQYLGQPIFVVVAESRRAALRAARRATVVAEPLPAVLSIDDAVAAESWVLPPVNLLRGDAAAALSAAPHRLSGRMRLGGQEQFYLEGQISYACPGEDGQMKVFCSTQHPTEMQHAVAHALHVPAHDVTVECRRMGGGFGGKESQSAVFACLAAVAAQRLGRPVKLRVDRDDDMLITGKRHDFRIDYDVGFDADGLIRGVRFELASRCGFSADLSGPVNDRAVFHADNAYYLDAVAIRSLRCKTHTQSNTAFRGFGGPQGMMAIETVVDRIAQHLGLDPLDVRLRNLYGGEGRDTTPYGMRVDEVVLPDLMRQLERSSQYRERRAQIARFNARQPIVKRG
ncbi:MAG: molybdopterin-dependent oxidoreductase, partial [Betaproteobacteria bacterium]|nr:molybdopterin-dependent oxidoreductase [Betaproteobacteria bacterium]